MGKKGHRTRWRTLTITGEHSDSEESSSTNQSQRGGYHSNKGYYGRYPYSSQSTPTRRYQCDSATKSTRSSSTASDTKITFNEDEYTRITTPRQDVLFKKGYLNKPKSYQTQSSTGNSTTSTTNSTGNGTPDHQSTDLDYESQFVFPNGFVDHNGIYYINGFESYPLMVYNPPTYYPEFSDVKAKRSSTGSLTESASPANDEEESEVAPEAPTTPIPEYSPHYNVIYPGFYIDGACPAAPEMGADRPKKKRRRKLSDGEEATSEEESEEEEPKGATFNLKPDAEEFVPRTYQEGPTNVQFIKLPSNFVPVPILNHPIEFMHPINFVPHNYYVPNCNSNTVEEIQEDKVADAPKNHIDIAKIVSKLEEAAKEQEEDEKLINTTPIPLEVSHNNKKPRNREERKKRPVWKPQPPNSPKITATRNYSDTLKERRVVPVIEKPKPVLPTTPQETTPKKTEPKSPNRWISVSNRKKRKNKNVEASEDFEETEEVPIEIIKDDHLFESYDIDLLEDVVPIEDAIVPTVEEVVPIVEEKEPEFVSVPKTNTSDKKKKKTKKVGARMGAPVRRVIIKDADLVIHEPLAEPEQPIEEIKEVVEKPEPLQSAPVEEELCEPEKKPRKKKKKAKTFDLSLSSSITNLVDDSSYDFLLESSMDSRTNVEVSQELDKLIQRGMYNNLEEKIKLLHSDSSNDSFFQSVIRNMSSREPSVEKSDLAQFLVAKPKGVNLEPVRAKLDSAPILGDFLGESSPVEEAPPGELYPITKAVKEWMTKTRETTPDVEIFKSPNALLKEFGEEEESVDLLECWEDDLGVVREKSASPEKIEEEEELEVYESKYGKNEDFLKIRAEVEGKSPNFPKHGNLPYRAICCSIM